MRDFGTLECGGRIPFAAWRTTGVVVLHGREAVIRAAMRYARFRVV